MERSRNDESVFVDSRGNTFLHLAAKLSRHDELAWIQVGEALLMQYELQRFKLLESIVSDQLREQRKYDGKTARMVFVEEHQHLMREGEKWTIGIRTYYVLCMRSAAFFVTSFLFAATKLLYSINPNLYDTWAFGILFHSYRFGKITSIISFLTFALIKTSHYTEDDFLYHLPKELFIGMTTLFFSTLYTVLVLITHGYLYYLGQDMESFMLMNVFVFVVVATYKFVNLPFLRLLFFSAFDRW